MKKVLFATTALVATAGVAAADVSISGYAEMGVIGGTGMDAQFHTDIDATFSMSGTTDNGLTFGASVDLDESDGNSLTGASPAFGNTTQGGETIFISGGFGTITMGDTDGALDWAMDEVAGVGSINDDETTHGGYNGNAHLDGIYDGQIMRWDYSAGAFGIAVSAEIDDAGVLDPALGIGAKYGMDLGGTMLKLGIGYQSNGAAAGLASAWGVSLAADMGNGLSGAINYSTDDYNTATDQTHVGVGVTYTTGAVAVHANYGKYSDVAGVAGTSAKGYGFAASYDLGGGAKIHAGYGHTNGGANTWSLGAALSF